MKVRYSYLSQQFSNCDDLWQNLKKFVKTGDFTLGKELQEFEKKFANLIGTKYAVGVNSGTDALKLPLKALGIKAGDEIITAANTFVATIGAINELGAKPIFVDCDDTFCMDTDLLEAAITEKTKAIVPVHFTGYMTDMRKLMPIAEKFNISVIVEEHTVEEAKQALKFEDALIGINNRNLKTLKTDINTTFDIHNVLVNHKGSLISESGIKTKDELLELTKKTSIKTFLIGESLLKNLDKNSIFSVL